MVWAPVLRSIPRIEGVILLFAARRGERTLVAPGQCFTKDSGMERPTLSKSAFDKYDAGVRCPTEDCWGDLLLFPTGEADEDGVPGYQKFTAGPLGAQVFRRDPD